MGTRGIYGFYKDGVDKLTYKHMDSYPSYLGAEIIDFIKTTSIEELNKIFDKIILVNGDSKPTEEQIKECEDFTNLGVSNQSTSDWYCILRNSQGDLNAYKGNLKYMIDNKGFIKDSLFCEWGYIINLDDNILEIYRGLIRSRNSRNNRYWTLKHNGYCACEIIKTFPLNNIPDNWLEILEPSEEH
ncbi:MAG TPA: hypothetical protein DC057_14520 [Spirochaetia bacterium]|nr:hypothetical protein [Spirochaetia bacterium]